VPRATTTPHAPGLSQKNHAGAQPRTKSLVASFSSEKEELSSEVLSKENLLRPKSFLETRRSASSQDGRQYAFLTHLCHLQAGAAHIQRRRGD
jgi:hypothetical protein